MLPKPASVRYNDWRQVDMLASEVFTPTLPVSVILPTWQPPAGMLERTLAALEGQTWPRDLFEVVIVDDGSEPPVEAPRSTPLDVKVVRQERRGFGAARARNNGARAAAHDILLFLDSDMLAEAGWIAAHARWHYAVSDAMTLGFYAFVAVDGLDLETVRRRRGSLKELFSGRPADPPWFEGHMLRTDDLTSRADDLFRVVSSGNFGIRKQFYESVGGFDESFMRYGLEDTELGYRAYTRGGLLVPVWDAFAWHQGRWCDGRDAKDRDQRIMRSKAAHLIAHRGFRRSGINRVFAVPQYVVTVEAGHCPTEQVIAMVATLLADRVYDLVVRIETPSRDGDERLALLRDLFGPEPRVRVAPARSALDEFPVSSFHVTLPAGATFANNLVHRLRARLGSAVAATAILPDGSRVSITRTWALHRARRQAASPADFGEARTISAASLKFRNTANTAPAVDAVHTGATDMAVYPARWALLLGWIQDVRNPGEAWSLLRAVATMLRWRARIKR